MLQATVQGHFKFLGKMRKTGDILTAEDLAQTTTNARDALVSQKLIVLSEDGEGGQVSQMPGGFEARLGQMEQVMAAIAVKLGIDVAPPAPAAKVEKPKKAPKAKKAAAPKTAAAPPASRRSVA